MEGIIQKLRFTDQERVAIINASDDYAELLAAAMPGAQTDRSIDQRFLYRFMLVFVNNSNDVKHFTSPVLHNLAADGLLWFVYPKKKCKSIKPDINRDNGWESLNEKGFRAVTQVAIDECFSALRFRNIEYIKTKDKRQKTKV